jgi:glycosyltransferase involved in cell wall biosynthesis
MRYSPDFSVVIPARDEAGNIPEVIAKLEDGPGDVHLAP